MSAPEEPAGEDPTSAPPADPRPPVKSAEELLARYLEGPIPPLRHGVTAEIAPDDRSDESGVIQDLAHGITIRVHPIVAEAAAALDGRASARDVAKSLFVNGEPVMADRLASAAVVMDAYFLLDTPRARRHAERARPPAPPKPREQLTGDDLRFIPGARYSCNGNGGCCKGFRISPILPPDIVKLERHDWRGIIPALADGSSPVRVLPRADGCPPAPGDKIEYHLAQKGGGCVFLEETGLCTVHKLFGAEEKPLVCRTFPFVGISRTDGKIDVGLVFECPCIPASVSTGTPLIDMKEEIVAVLRAWPVESRVTPHLFLVAPAAAVPVAFVDRLDAFALRLLSRDAPADERALALARAVQTVTRSLGPLPEDQAIEQLGARLETVDVERFYGESRPGASEARAVAALRDCLAEMGRTMAEEALWRAETGDDEQKLITFREAAGAVLSLCRRLEEGIDQEILTAPFWHKDAARVDPALDDPDVALPLIEWLKNEVFGKTWFAPRELLRGTGEILVRWALLRWECKRVAHARRGKRVEPRDVHAALCTMSRSFRSSAMRRAFDSRQTALRTLVENPLPFGSGII